MVSTPVDVDFSLALHNRTGKYFIGRDILTDNHDLIGNVYFWRRAAATPPTGLRARIFGRALVIEQRLILNGVMARQLRRRNARPVLHLDPHTVINWALKPSDIVFCHDVGPVTHPHLFDPGVPRLYEAAYGAAASIKPKMVFLSEASRSAFVERWGRWDAMDVIYPQIRAEAKALPPKIPPGITGRFFLCVGSLGKRKNQATLIRGFAASKLHDDGYSLVLCGQREVGADAVDALAAHTPGAIVLPYVTDQELVWLYQNAEGFALPSLLEGFGVPVAEAIANDLIPIVTRESVLEEVAGDGALRVDPNDPEAIGAAMRHLASMEADERSERKERLHQSVARFSATRFSDAWRRVLSE